MNFKQVLQLFVDDLAPLYELEERKAIFGIVAFHLSGLERGQLMLKAEEELSSAAFIAYSTALQELKTGRPLQYVLGETTFYGLPFRTAPGVLIPRPETEELVDWLIRTAGQAPRADLRILDIGTGSGCIAVSLKHAMPEATVSAMDISPEALQIAKENADLNQVVIDFIEADIRTCEVKPQFDIIVSNPPYITMAEQSDMHENVLAHEPHLALFVPDETPLVFYEAIADFASAGLRAGGYLYFEINAHFGPQTLELMEKIGFVDLELRQDMQGKDRMISGRWM